MVKLIISDLKLVIQNIRYMKTIMVKENSFDSRKLKNVTKIEIYQLVTKFKRVKEIIGILFGKPHQGTKVELHAYY